MPIQPALADESSCKRSAEAEASPPAQCSLMRLDDATVKSLRSYLLQTLASISSDLQDPGPLAEYVIALLQEDKSDEELRHTVRTHCYEFLRDKTLGFVTDLFAYLSKTHRPSGIRDSGPVYGSPRASRESDHDDVPARRRRSASPQKRRYDDNRGDRGDRSDRSERRSALPIPTVDFYDRRRRWDDGGHRGREMDESQYFPRQRERDRAPEDVIALSTAPEPRVPMNAGPAMLPLGMGMPMPVPVLDPGFVPGMDRFGNMPLGVATQPLPQRFHGDEERGQKREKRWRREGEGSGEAAYDGAGGDRWQRRPKGEKQQRNPESSTVKVLSIPPELNTAEKLIGHFKQFGNIINIQIATRNNRATVQFARHEEALLALRSPEAVLGNRFIKILWSNEDDGTAGKEAAAAEAAARLAEGAQAHTDEGEALRASGSAKSESERPAAVVASPVPDKAAIARRQQREEIRKQIADAIAMADKVKDPTKKAEVVKMINRLVATLEALVKKDAEAASATAGAAAVVPPPTEFAGRGRGRGSPVSVRGRGGIVRGRGRGRGGAAPQPGGRTLVLDNRPTTLVIANPPADLSGDKLLAHFKPFGEVTSFSVANTHATVQFATRRSAEVALSNGKTLNGSELTMSWLLPPSDAAEPPVPAAAESVQTEVVPVEEGFNGGERLDRIDGEEGEGEDGERNWKR